MDEDRPMGQVNLGEPVRRVTIPIVLGLTALVIVCLGLLWQGRKILGLSHASGFHYPIEKTGQIPADRLEYREVALYRLPVGGAKALAIGSDDTVAVVCEKSLLLLEPDGSVRMQKPLEGSPSCVAIGGMASLFPGRIYIGVGNEIWVLKPDGTEVSRWKVPGHYVHLTSLAVGSKELYAADFGQWVVFRFNLEGELLGRIAEADENRGLAGLVIPSPYFDVACGVDGLVWVVNPGARRIEGYTPSGNLELFWSKGGSAALDDFFGCCNPANIAILPSGHFVTAEKGLLRIKIYSPEGELAAVVAGPEQLDLPEIAAQRDQFDHEHRAVDIAVDSRGRIWALAVGTNMLQVFQKIENE